MCRTPAKRTFQALVEKISAKVPCVCDRDLCPSFPLFLSVGLRGYCRSPQAFGPPAMHGIGVSMQPFKLHARREFMTEAGDPRAIQDKRTQAGIGCLLQGCPGCSISLWPQVKCIQTKEVRPPCPQRRQRSRGSSVTAAFLVFPEVRCVVMRKPPHIFFLTSRP